MTRILPMLLVAAAVFAVMAFALGVAGSALVIAVSAAVILAAAGGIFYLVFKSSHGRSHGSRPPAAPT